jgi:hypothetical protein
VESAINALEAHGLDICRDHGIDAFKRYVAWPWSDAICIASAPSCWRKRPSGTDAAENARPDPLVRCSKILRIGISCDCYLPLTNCISGVSYRNKNAVYACTQYNAPRDWSVCTMGEMRVILIKSPHCDQLIRC